MTRNSLIVRLFIHSGWNKSLRFHWT